MIFGIREHWWISWCQLHSMSMVLMYPLTSGQQVLIVECLKAVYGAIVAILLYYKKFVKVPGCR